MILVTKALWRRGQNGASAQVLSDFFAGGRPGVDPIPGQGGGGSATGDNDQLREHAGAFVAAYDFGRRLGTRNVREGRGGIPSKAYPPTLGNERYRLRSRFGTRDDRTHRARIDQFA